MEPIPVSIDVARALEWSLGETGIEDDLRSLAGPVQAVVPDCIGLSLAWTEHGVTFTLVSSDEEIALFDALQYLAGGPCVDAVHEGKAVAVDHQDLMGEERWRLFAQETAARGVRSTLTLPLTEQGQVVGSVNLYGASSNAFEGHHEELARVLGASAPGAVRNADLSFSSRANAEDSLEVLRGQRSIDTAAGILAVRFDIGLEAALERLVDAARRAGVTAQGLAELLIDEQT